MKIKTTVATLSILSVLSFGAFAAEPISAEQAQNREAIGSVSVSAIGSHLPSHITCPCFAEISHKKSPLIREVDPIKE